METLHTSELTSLPLVSRGKVRDIYAIDDDRLLIVQSDRISAFDVVMNEAVPDKGAVLTEMSYFWFARSRRIAANHLLAEAAEDVVTAEERAQIRGRAMVVRRLNPLPIEAVCRGYLIGSGWKDYCNNGSVCGITLPTGLALAARLPETIFTPATKAQAGEHDENISFAQMAELIGAALAQRVRDTTLQLYEEAAAFAAEKGIIIADTKFEFAEADGELILIDEVLTPDSSRFWRGSSWQPGQNPDSFDKQFMRDWLETTGWNKTPPPPAVPPEVINQTAAKYREIRNLLMGAGS